MNYLRPLFLPLFIGLFMNAYAQPPEWSVNDNDYEHSMSMIAFLTLNGSRLDSENDRVGAFVQETCRGFTNLIYVESQDAYFAYFNILANQNNETIHFKLYNSKTGEVVDAENTINFVIGKHIGNVFQAYSISSPSLNNEADMLTFGFSNASIISSDNSNGIINVYMDDNISIHNLIPEFELSVGAELFYNRVALVSGQEAIDFTNPVEFEVRAEDQSIINTFIVNIDQTGTPVPVVYKRNVTCQSDGAIKILHCCSTEQAMLFFEGEKIQTSNDEVEVLFQDLEPGIYKVKIGTFEKNITIE